MATAKSKTALPAPATPKTSAAPARSAVKTTARPSAKTSTASVTPRAKAKPAASQALRLTTAKTAGSKTDRKKDKPEKIKVLRDSFTIPKAEFAQIATLKKRAMALGQEVKKSELLRAGLLLLGKQGDSALLKALATVPTLKTGRPGKA